MLRKYEGYRRFLAGTWYLIPREGKNLWLRREELRPGERESAIQEEEYAPRRWKTRRYKNYLAARAS